jgi:hypothetical protein
MNEYGLAICHQNYQSEKAESLPVLSYHLCYNNKHSGIITRDVARDHFRPRLRRESGQGSLAAECYFEAWLCLKLYVAVLGLYHIEVIRARLSSYRVFVGQRCQTCLRV